MFYSPQKRNNKVTPQSQQRKESDRYNSENKKSRVLEVEFQLGQYSIFGQEAIECMQPENKQLKKVIFQALNSTWSNSTPPIHSVHASLRDKVVNSQLHKIEQLRDK